MEGLVIIIYCISVAITCMTLGLAIANTVFHRSVWCRLYVVFQACILTTVFLGFLNKTSHATFPDTIVLVFNYIFRIFEHAVIAFVSVLLPYFLKWLLGKKWGSGQRVEFYTIGIIYFAAGLVSVLIRNNRIAQYIQTPLFIFVCGYGMVTLRRNLSVIDERSRSTCIAVIIGTYSLIPLSVLSLIFPVIDNFAFPVYILTISIIMMVYFYKRFSLDSSKLHKKNAIDDKTIDRYKITDRELTVIKLVCEGLTNKEIAANLNISVNTVNNHVANVFEKTGVRSRVELLRILNVGPWD